jgi:sugar lactone lactonase YvrE
MFRMSAELLVDAHAELAEGPVWDDRVGRLWWVDLLGGNLHEIDPSTGGDRSVAVGRALGAVALRRDGGLVAAVSDGFATLDPDSGVAEVRAPAGDPDPSMRMNDGKPDAQGRFWAGRMANDETPRAGGLYRLDADWSVAQMLDGLTIPNGLGWSPDGRWMYFADSPTRRVDRFAFDADAGALGEREPFVTVDEGFPDGLTVDADGGVWVALYDGGGVVRYGADGRPTAFVQVPARQATCPTFGGAGLDVLFVTTGREGFGAEGPPGEPHAGGLFACRPGFVGLPANRFAG